MNNHNILTQKGGEIKRKEKTTMEKLKQWLINELLTNPNDFYNESTLIWSKGYRKACMKILNIINKIDLENKK